MKTALVTLIRRSLILFSLVFFHASAAAAQATTTEPRADALERNLSGTWVGALEYRDYESGKKFELPMTTRIEVGVDGATVSRVSAFDDGPKTGMVYITTTSLFDGRTSRTTSAIFRKGRPVETLTDDVVVREYKDAQHWTMIYSRKGTDGDSQAAIRVIQTLAGSELTEVKEFKPASAPDSDYAIRNQIRLRRQ